MGWGHKILPGERYFGTNHDKTAGGRAPCGKTCGSFARCSGNSGRTAFAWHACLQRGTGELLGSKTIPKSTLIKKLEAGDRNIYREYIAFCNYKGKRHAMLLQTAKGGVCAAVRTTIIVRCANLSFWHAFYYLFVKVKNMDYSQKLRKINNRYNPDSSMLVEQKNVQWRIFI